MRTEPELLNERLDRLALVLDEIMPNCANLVRDALDLLKEQEAVEPKQIGQGWFCGACDALLSIGNEKIVKFCSMCGKPVKWE